MGSPVSVNPAWVSLCATEPRNAGKDLTVAGFARRNHDLVKAWSRTRLKLWFTEDMVMNGRAEAAYYDRVEHEIRV